MASLGRLIDSLKKRRGNEETRKRLPEHFHHILPTTLTPDHVKSKDDGKCLSVFLKQKSFLETEFWEQKELLPLSSIS